MLGALALFVALGGPSYAKTAVVKLIDGSKIKKGTIQVDRLSTKARKALRGNVGPRGIQGPQGNQGSTGATGPSTGPAGGDLTGTYPNPTIAPAEASKPVAPALSTTADCPATGRFCGSVSGHQWQNFGDGYAPVAYYKDRAGIVHLEGAATQTGTLVSTVFYLPVGYQPASDRLFATEADLDNSPGHFAYLKIGSDGSVTETVPDQSGTTKFVSSISFDGVSFRP